MNSLKLIALAAAAVELLGWAGWAGGIGGLRAPAGLNAAPRQSILGSRFHAPSPPRVSGPVAPGGPAAGSLVRRADGGADRPARWARFEMPWSRREGLRLRVVYVDARGETRGDAHGFRVEVPGRPVRYLRAQVHESLRGPLPVYSAGEVVSMEVELKNTGARTLRHLRVALRQEAFQASGLKGRPRGPRLDPWRVAVLKPGRTVTLRRRVRLSADAPPGGLPVNFEQTHVAVRQDAPDRKTLLLDAPQAGIVDPPNP